MYDPSTAAQIGYAFMHWAIIDIPRTYHRIPEGASTSGKLPYGSQQLSNGFIAAALGEAEYVGYIGPCPPVFVDPHFYRTTIFLRDNKNLGSNYPSTVESEGNADALISYLLTDGHTIGIADNAFIFPRPPSTNESL